MRTPLQCQARGCDGCVVCDRDNFTLEELKQYRQKEAAIAKLFTPSGMLKNRMEREINKGE